MNELTAMEVLEVKYVDLTLQVKKTNRVYKQAETQTKKNIVMGHVGTHFDIYGDIQVPLDYMNTNTIPYFKPGIFKDEEADA